MRAVCVCVCHRVKVQQELNTLMNSQVAFAWQSEFYNFCTIFSLKLQCVKFHLYAMFQLPFNLHACCVHVSVCVSVCVCVSALFSHLSAKRILF